MAELGGSDTKSTGHLMIQLQSFYPQFHPHLNWPTSAQHCDSMGALKKPGVASSGRAAALLPQTLPFRARFFNNRSSDG
jgi:hypothetical protein